MDILLHFVLLFLLFEELIYITFLIPRSFFSGIRMMSFVKWFVRPVPISATGKWIF